MNRINRTKARAAALTLCALAAAHDAASEANYERLINWVKKEFPDQDPAQYLPPDRALLAGAAEVVKGEASNLLAEILGDLIGSGSIEILLLERRPRQRKEESAKEEKDNTAEDKASSEDFVSVKTPEERKEGGSAQQ